MGALNLSYTTYCACIADKVFGVSVVRFVMEQ